MCSDVNGPEGAAYMVSWIGHEAHERLALRGGGDVRHRGSVLHAVARLRIRPQRYRRVGRVLDVGRPEARPRDHASAGLAVRFPGVGGEGLRTRVTGAAHRTAQ